MEASTEAENSAPIPAVKYHKLATEYAKLRAQASVLKKAVLEEQAKMTNLREQLRQKETQNRRNEQEVDSLSFRNKQLEHRVYSLQEDIAASEKKHNHKKGFNKKDVTATQIFPENQLPAQEALIFEELQKKIMENAQLTSLIDDKERDIQLHAERISNLELCLQKRHSEQNDLEKRLRREMETLQSRNAELETKLVEAASMLGSEDTLSASGSDNITNANSHAVHHSGEERIANLEREVAHWRTQYELCKLQQNFSNENPAKQTQQEQHKPYQFGDANCSSSTAAAALSIKPSFLESKNAQRARESLQEPLIPPTKEQLIYNCFSLKFEQLLLAKCIAESRVNSYMTEMENLQNCLENATHELKSKDELVQSINQAIQMLEDDLSTTRLNYEEQISVLTEQVLILSDQLAASK